MQKVTTENSTSDFRIIWLSIPEMEAPEALLRKRSNGELLRGILSIVDVARMLCANCIDTDTPNTFYNGYTSKVEGNNLLVFFMDS